MSMLGSRVSVEGGYKRAVDVGTANEMRQLTRQREADGDRNWWTRA